MTNRISPPRKRKRSIADTMIGALASFGLTQLTGVPFLMFISSSVLDMFSIVFGGLSAATDAAAEAISPVITYSPQEAEKMIQAHESNGAQVSSYTQNPDGSIDVEYDLTHFTGDIEADAIDIIGDLF